VSDRSPVDIEALLAQVRGAEAWERLARALARAIVEQQREQLRVRALRGRDR
jgi:hypothetical protein